MTDRPDPLVSLRELAEWASKLCDDPRRLGQHDRECPVDRARAALNSIEGVGREDDRWRIAQCPHCGEELSVAASPSREGAGLDEERLRVAWRQVAKDKGFGLTSRDVHALAAEYARLASEEQSS